MRFTDDKEFFRRWRQVPLLTAATAVAGMALVACNSPMPAGTPAPASTTAPAPGTRVAAAPGPSAAPLPPPKPAANWKEWRRQAAERLVAANPKGSYVGAVPEALLAIPVIEMELNRDGSVRKMVVLRAPRQAKDTEQLAMDAIKRAGPFGDVSHLPRPWRYVETFLFDDDRRFKPRTLDE